VPMSSLVAGDLVLADETSSARVIVNQHLPSDAVSSMVTLHHIGGALTLTEDHVLILEGRWTPAREATPGSLLSNGNAISRVTATRDGIVNPLTTAGTILANGVVASCYPEWIASHMLSSQVYPLPLSASNLLSYLFPLSTQAFYDGALEPFFAGGNRKYLEAVPPALVVPAIAALDVLIVCVFLGPALAAAALLSRIAGKARG